MTDRPPSDLRPREVGIDSATPAIGLKDIVRLANEGGTGDITVSALEVTV